MSRSPIPRQGSSAWVAWRRGGVGASELPAILGEDPWRGEYELALLKRGEAEPEPQNEAQAWGHRVEAAALDLYSEMTGRDVRRVRTTLVSRTHPHVYASLDGRCVRERRGVEVKLTRAWTEPPRRVLVQVQAQMAVARLDAIDVVRVGMGYQAPAVTTVERDPDVGEELLELGEAWYRRYVMGDELPPVDGSRAASRHLDRLRGEGERQADEAQEGLLASLRAVRATLARASDDEARILAALKQSMAGTGALVSPTARVTWSAVRGRTSTDWRALAQELGADEAAVARHTTTGEPTTRFAVRFEEEG